MKVLAAVIHLRRVVEVKAVHLSSNRFEKGRATAANISQLFHCKGRGSNGPARRTKDNEHLSALQHAVYPVQDLDLALAVADEITSRGKEA
jgi:hypothetical protein